MTTEIATTPTKENALAVFSAAQGLDPYLAVIRAEIDGFIPDVTTRKGRDAIASIAHKVARSKTALDNVGKELVAELKDIPKKIDAERKRMRDLLDAWKDEVRKPLDDWDAAELARVTKLQKGVEWFSLRATENKDLDATELKDSLAVVEGIIVGEKWEEFEAEAHRAKAAAIEALTAQLARREKADAEQSELAKLRAEAEVREKQDREEQIAREAADKALDLAEAAAAAERKRQADAQAEEERQTAAREADTIHKTKVLKAAKVELMNTGITEEQAVKIVNAIRKGLIPNVTLSF